MFSSKSLIRNNAAYPGFVDSLRPVSEELLRADTALGGKTRALIEELKAQAHAEAEQAGYAAGYELGHREGTVKGQQEFDEAHSQAIAEFKGKLTDFMVAAEEAMEKWHQEAEERLADLGIEVARRALHQELSLSRDSIMAIASDALRQLSPTSRVRIRCNPWDGSILESRRLELTAAMSGIQGIDIVEDTHLMGGCIVETDGGVVDATIDSYLDRLQDEAA